MSEREVTIRIKLELPEFESSTRWEFLNSDGYWVRCVGGEAHAREAAAHDGPSKYREVATLTSKTEYRVEGAGDE